MHKNTIHRRNDQSLWRKYTEVFWHFKGWTRLKQKGTKSIDDSLPCIYSFYSHTEDFGICWSQIPLPGLQRWSTCPGKAMLLARMDAGVDGVCMCWGPGRSPAYGWPVRKLSEFFWEQWDEVIHFLYIGNEDHVTLKLSPVILEMWENLTEETVIETKRMKQS